MKVGVLGSGKVGEILANGFLKHGFEVMRGSRDPDKLSAWQGTALPGAKVGMFSETAKFGELLVLAVKGLAAEDALDLCGIQNLAGKTILDTTTPLADAPPVNGVVPFFTGPNESLMERLQLKVPSANFVKCFSCVGNARMVNPSYKHGPPSMFICGNNESAKLQARDILTLFGWETEDMGMMESARAIEPLGMLWSIPGFRSNKWFHSFKLLKD